VNEGASNPKPLLVGICGGSSSGKTTLAHRVQKLLLPIRSAIIRFDSYYRSLDHLPLKERSHRNFDCLEMLEWELLAEHLKKLKAGESADIPVYDFKTHCRMPRARRTAPQPVILVEGILLLAVPAIVGLLDLKVYIEVEADIRLARRIGRDIRQRGRSVESVLEQYFDTVRPMHEKLVAPTKSLADLIVTGGGENPEAVAEVIARIRRLLPRTNLK